MEDDGADVVVGVIVVLLLLCLGHLLLPAVVAEEEPPPHRHRLVVVVVVVGLGGLFAYVWNSLTKKNFSGIVRSISVALPFSFSPPACGFFFRKKCGKK